MSGCQCFDCPIFFSVLFIEWLNFWYYTVSVGIFFVWQRFVVVYCLDLKVKFKDIPTMYNYFHADPSPRRRQKPRWSWSHVCRPSLSRTLLQTPPRLMSTGSHLVTTPLLLPLSREKAEFVSGDAKAVQRPTTGQSSKLNRSKSH